MTYYKTMDSGCILSIGTGPGGTGITESEYAEILAVIRSKPSARDGFDYRLKTDRTWEECELPPAPTEEEEAEAADYEAALAELGVHVND